MIPLIEENKERLIRICQNNNVSELYIFGSAVTGEFTDNSDLDFAVQLKNGLTPLEHGDSFLALLFDLEELFDRKIDLVSYRVVKNPIFKEQLDSTKVALYAA